MRLLKYNGAAFAVILALWSLLVVVEVKVHAYAFLKYLSLLSLPVAVSLHCWANWVAFSRTVDEGDRIVRTAFATLILTPLSMTLGLIAIVNLKWRLGGHI